MAISASGPFQTADSRRLDGWMVRGVQKFSPIQPSWAWDVWVGGWGSRGLCAEYFPSRTYATHIQKQNLSGKYFVVGCARAGNGLRMREGAKKNTLKSPCFPSVHSPAWPCFGIQVWKAALDAKKGARFADVESDPIRPGTNLLEQRKKSGECEFPLVNSLLRSKESESTPPPQEEEEGRRGMTAQKIGGTLKSFPSSPSLLAFSSPPPPPLPSFITAARPDSPSWGSISCNASPLISTYKTMADEGTRQGPHIHILLSVHLAHA